MFKSLSEKKSAGLLGKWFTLKALGYELLLIDAFPDGKQIAVEYYLKKEDGVETVNVKVPVNSTIPSITGVFPQGVQMEMDISQRFPVVFQQGEKEENLPEHSLMEWGPFHPLLPEPVKFRILMKNEVIGKAWIETGYNYRGLEELCAGKKPEDVLEMLERTSSINGLSMSMAFAHAIERINEVEVPEKIQWLRMILMEMSFLHAHLQSLIQTALSLGLLSFGSRLFRLTDSFHEATALLSSHHQLIGLVEIGGLSRDISKETLYGVNAILQEMEQELKDIRRHWENTSSIFKRLEAAGKIGESQAKLMTGRLTRSAGFPEDPRRGSVLPWSKIPYTVPITNGSNCFARAMLMFDDALLSLQLIDGMVENLPKGNEKASARADGSGEALLVEPEAYGAMAVLVKQEKGRIQSVRLRNSSALNISFLPACLYGMEIHDLPMVAATFDLDLSGMEK